MLQTILKAVANICFKIVFSVEYFLKDQSLIFVVLNV